MAMTTKTGGFTRTADPCNPEPQACPSCGGLECLCRPRFFAGQLLTEENLNQLNSYILKKNQLHNRYLHGSGVVCGLQVSCEPCDDKHVRVNEGYALSPCGNDIIVCSDDSVDIYKLLKECRGNEPRDCRPYAKPDRQCDGAEETWILAICYEESASRGITALRSQTQNSCADRGPRGAPPQCEPTQVCEGYSYRLFKQPEPSIKELGDRFTAYFGATGSRGPFYDQLICCLLPLLKLLRESKLAKNQTGLKQCCHYKAKLKEIILQHDSGNCELLRRLECIPCEEPMESNDNGAKDALFQLFLIGWQLLIDCLCNALMPPCPGEEPDDCVPLAAITVSGKDCRVIKVCNWTEQRKYVITMPTLKYWLSILTRGRGPSRVIERLCCDAIGLMDALDSRANKATQNAGAGEEPSNQMNNSKFRSAMALDMQPQFDAQWLKGNQEFSSILFKSMLRQTGDLSLERVMGGLAQSGDEPEKMLLSPAERDNPAEFLTINLLLQPFLKSFLPQGNLQDLDALRPKKHVADENVDAAKQLDLSQMQVEMREMKRTMDAQALEINELRNKLNGDN